MSYLDGYYLNDHVWQFDGTPFAGSNCTPTTGANGARATTAGRMRRTGGQIRSLVGRTEETNPRKPGWSLEDLDLALSRLYPPQVFGIRSGYGWDRLVQDHEAGLYIAVQDDQDVITTPKCAAAFDGDHCFGVHPATRVNPDTGREQWWVNDPLCPTGGWRDRKQIHDAAAKLGEREDVNIFYGVWTTPVPRDPSPPDLWCSDVPQAIQDVNPTGITVARAIVWAKAEGNIKPPGIGSCINMSDLRDGFRGIDMGYGKVIEPKDVQRLAAAYKAAQK